MKPSLLRAALLLSVLAVLLGACFFPLYSRAAPGPEHSLASPPSTLSAQAVPVATELPAKESAPAPTAAVHPVAAAPSCPLPNAGRPPHWNGTNFWTDASVTFSLPGQAANSWTNFGTIPCTNVVPTYASGFWMNVTTDVTLFSASVTIWGLQWSTNGSGAPITNFDPVSPAILPMVISGAFHRQASFFFNTYKNFWPGSTVGFNLTLQSANGTPSVIRSASTPPFDPITYVSCGCTDIASFLFNVQTPWASTNFSNDIEISTTPNVLTPPIYEPNKDQSFQITLRAINLSGGPPTPIPNATLNAREYVNGSLTTIGEYFGPENHSVMTLPTPLPPQPGAVVIFNVSAWLPWLGGIIDPIYSPDYMFNWSPNGGWAAPRLGLTDNLNLSADPSGVTLPGPMQTLATGTPVNVTIHEPVPNITIGSATLLFQYSDKNGASNGTIPMTAMGQNTSYLTLPGLPDGGKMTFSIQAKDIFGVPVASNSYTYKESGATNLPIPIGSLLQYVEVVDATTGALVPSFNVTFANASWSESVQATPFGFGAPLPPAGPGYLYVTFGSYVITVHAFGKTGIATVNLPANQALATPVVFYLPSGGIPAPVPAALPILTIVPAIGLAAAAVTMVPVVRWYKERRAQAEAEQRRITL
jgi:hypothetical protein